MLSPSGDDHSRRFHPTVLRPQVAALPLVTSRKDFNTSVPKMVNPSHLYAAIASTIQTFFVDYDRAPVDGPSVLSNTLTPDCRRYLRPYTFTDALGFPRDFYFNNTAYEAGIASELTVTQTANWTVLFTSIDAENLRASAFSEYRVSLCGTGEYLIEVSWFWDFAEDGSKIRSIVEVLEPITTLNYSAKAVEIAATGQTC